MSRTEWWTTARVAEHLGISTRLVCRLADEGRFGTAAVRLSPRLWRFDSARIDAELAAWAHRHARERRPATAARQDQAEQRTPRRARRVIPPTQEEQAAFRALKSRVAAEIAAEARVSGAGG